MISKTRSSNLSFKHIVGGLLVLFTALLLGCGKGGSSSSNQNQNQNQTVTGTGTITGLVSDNTTGLPISGATVAVGALTTTSAADGTYRLASVPAATRAVVNISKTGYANGSKVTAVINGVTSPTDATLLPVLHTATVSSAIANNVVVPGSTATVSLPANGFASATRAVVTGNISVAVTPIDASSNPELMPGDFTTSTGGQIESFGAMDVTLSDSTGAAVNLAPGSSATIRIPVAASATNPPATMPAWYYNATTGQWVNEGTLTLAGTPGNQYYEGVVTHFSNWNADKPLSTTCVTGKVVDSTGAPVANVRVTSQGQGYTGTSSATSAANGTFTINIKALASALISAKTSTSQSNTIVATGGTAGTTCTPMSGDLVLGGSGTSGSASIKLTWGTNPSDLDSHLTGPQVGSATRFHVYYANPGSLTLAPKAKLDVDDVTSFGPEVITISTLTTGVYRYSVHHFSGTGGISSSPARVELTLNGTTRIFTPPTTPAVSGTVWEVFELTVDATGARVTTLNTLGTFGTIRSATNGNSSNTVKPPMVGGNW